MRRKAFWWIVLLGLMCLTISVALSQDDGRVRLLITNEFANIRVLPALGADVRGSVPAGYIFEIVNGRSADGEWFRVDFNGDEGWVNITTLAVISGDPNTLPVADPRTIPYGGFESPRSGLTSATSDVVGRLIAFLRVRAGPSTAYPVLANAPRNALVPILGRTASNGWLQINFEGTLGWVSTRYVELQGGGSIALVPIDGIVAEAIQPSQPVADDYLATLRLLLARLDLAQPSLDSIRGSWTDAALTGRASCQPYPAQPSDYNIPTELLAAYFNVLDPLQRLFNDAMFNLRRSIDLFIEVCNQPGTGNPVGQATVIGALEVLALVDSQFAELRGRLLELIPPDQEIGPNQCLFQFQTQFDVLPVIAPGQLIFDSFSREQIATGYCIDLFQGQSIIIETLQRPPNSSPHFIVFTAFDNPTSFVNVGRGTQGNPLLSVGPITVPRSTRYLIIVSNADAPTSVAPGEFGLLVTVLNPGSALNNFLTLDPAGNIIAITPVPGVIPVTPGVPGVPGTPVPGAPVQPPIVITVTPGP
ncbi:MAG: SH3 domain-containing protein [bacterium]|nr:SH3 domain-containing protein [bacterium]